jgi:hypothetical protein
VSDLIIPRDFYVYVHRTLSGRIFYVGKGHGKRAWSKKNRNVYWHRSVKKYGYTVEIVADCLQEWYAYELEFNLVCFYGRACENDGSLVNLTNGGAGPSSPSQETRQKISEKLRGKPGTNLGKKMSEETKKKLSEAKKGKPLLKLRGRPLSKETIAKQVAKRIGQPNGHLGLKRTDQARLNMCNAQQKIKNRCDISGDKNPSKRDDVRLKMSEARKGKYLGASNPQAKAVVCIENNMTFGSLADSHRWLVSMGVKGHIKLRLKSELTTMYGYTWRYA